MVCAKRFYHLAMVFPIFLVFGGAVIAAGNFNESPTIMVSYQQKLDDASIASHRQKIIGFSQAQEADIRGVCARVQNYYISKGFDRVAPVDCGSESMDSLSDKMPTLIDVMTRWTGYRQSTKYCAHFYPVPCPDISGSKYFKSFQSSFYDLTRKNMPRPELYISGIAGKCMKSSETGLGYNFGSNAYLTVYGDSDIPNFDSADVDIVSFCFYPVYENQVTTVSLGGDAKPGILGNGTKDDAEVSEAKMLSSVESAVVGSIGEEGGEIGIPSDNEKKKIRACCGVEDGGTACSKPGIWPNIRNRYKQMIQDSGGSDCNFDAKNRRLADLCIIGGNVCRKYNETDDWKNKWHSNFTAIEAEFQLIFRNANFNDVNDSKWDDYIKTMNL